ncbi:MAG: hypothetical protein ABW164_10770 [Sphingobium sp.]
MSRKTPPIVIRPPKPAGLLRKAARLGATVIAARVAAKTGKSGVAGIVAGVGAKRLIMRHPTGALLVTGAYLAGKAWEAKKEAERKRNQRLLTDRSGETIADVESAGNAPIPLDEARKARQG